MESFFSTRQELLFVWLFGSVVTGKANRFSDVDIYI
ncbi:nucleotidyltransferase domain-containing protein [Sporomusa silvacetica]